MQVSMQPCLILLFLEHPCDQVDKLTCVLMIGTIYKLWLAAVAMPFVWFLIDHSASEIAAQEPIEAQAPVSAARAV